MEQEICKISIEGKEHEIEFSFLFEILNKVFEIVKPEKNYNVVCTINLNIEGEPFVKEFQNVGYLITFLAGLSLGENKTQEKLEKYYA